MWKGEEGGRGLYLYTHTHTHTIIMERAQVLLCVCVLAGGRAIRKELSFTLSSTVPSSSLSLVCLSATFIAQQRPPPTALHCTALLYITGRSVMQFSGTRLCVCFLIADRQTRTAAAAAHTKRRRRKKNLLLHLFPPRLLCRSFVRLISVICRDFHCFSHEATVCCLE